MFGCSTVGGWPSLGFRRASQNDGIEFKMAPVAMNDQPAGMHRAGLAPAWLGQQARRRRACGRGVRPLIVRCGGGRNPSFGVFYALWWGTVSPCVSWAAAVPGRLRAVDADSTGPGGRAASYGMVVGGMDGARRGQLPTASTRSQHEEEYQAGEQDFQAQQ